MFKRRKPHGRLRQAREILWPSMGFRRAFRYVRLRIIRMSDSSHKIALGLAIGVAVSFSPLVGTHFIQAGLVAWLLRANILASLIGTFVGTPWTFPFMWWASIELGVFLTSFLSVGANRTLPQDINFSILWDIAFTEPLRLFLPWMVGGYVMALIVCPLSYILLYQAVHGARVARARAKLHRLHEAGRQITGQKR